MDSLVFFGSLRSKKLLKIIINSNLKHLKLTSVKIFKAKLFRVRNENFPYLEKTNSQNDIVNCTYVENLKKEDFKKILFYESIEYEIKNIRICKKEKNINSHFFDLIKKNKTKENWTYEKWKNKYEKLSCVAAKSWMLLFNKYKNNPGEAEIYWQEILNKATIQ